MFVQILFTYVLFFCFFSFFPLSYPLPSPTLSMLSRIVNFVSFSSREVQKDGSPHVTGQEKAAAIIIKKGLHRVEPVKVGMTRSTYREKACSIAQSPRLHREGTHPKKRVCACFSLLLILSFYFSYSTTNGLQRLRGLGKFKHLNTTEGPREFDFFPRAPMFI
eukprot:gene8170-5699_t